MDRSNESWLKQLTSDGAEQKAALSDLRGSLLRGLRSALWHWPQADQDFLEDVVQDSIIRILDKLDQFEGRSRFLTWATAIAIRFAMSDLRRKRWSNVSLDQLIQDRAFSLKWEAGDGNCFAMELDRQSSQGQIIRELYKRIESDLTEKQRKALLAELMGMPQDEIADQLGSNRNAVYKLTHDARKQLKRGLESAGFHADDLHAAFDH